MYAFALSRSFAVFFCYPEEAAKKKGERRRGSEKRKLHFQDQGLKWMMFISRGCAAPFFFAGVSIENVCKYNTKGRNERSLSSEQAIIGT